MLSLNKNVFVFRVYPFLWMLLQRALWSSAQTQTTPVQITQVLWALGPCQSAFWIPSSSSEFNSNWITYLFEGNPVSLSGECLFTLESDPTTRIEMVIQEVNLFGSASIQPPPCLTLYDVKQDGGIVMLKKECQAMLMDNALESQPTFTETNLAVISTTIRYGSFQLQARAVPKSYGLPTRVSSTTPTIAPSSTTSSSTTSVGTSAFPFPSSDMTSTSSTNNKTTTSTTVPPSLETITPVPTSNTPILSNAFRFDLLDSGRSGHNDV